MVKSARRTKYSVGYTGSTKQGAEFTIVRKDSYSCIYILFKGYEDFGEVKTNSKDICRGTTRNPFFPSVAGVGFTGVLDTPCKYERAYTMWSGMIRRCYSGEDKFKSWYKDCSVCEDWKCYNNFKKWYEKTSIILHDCLDKDIKVKGNKLYSPSTCLLVPPHINTLITNRLNYRGEQPVGVSLRGDRYVVRCSVYGEFKEVGRFYTEKEAFLCYKRFKERHIKVVAKEALLAKEITERTYKSIIKYKVDYED